MNEEQILEIQPHAGVKAAGAGADFAGYAGQGIEQIAGQGVTMQNASSHVGGRAEIHSVSPNRCLQAQLAIPPSRCRSPGDFAVKRFRSERKGPVPRMVH